MGTATPREVAEAENRLESFNRQRDRIVSTVERRVLERLLAAAETREECSLEYVLNEVAFAEIRRYERERSREAQKKLHRWRDLALRLGRMPADEKSREVAGLVGHYVRDVVGNFNPRVYRFTSGMLPPALSFLLRPVSSVRDGVDALGSMEAQVHVEGSIDLVRAACDRGTVIFTPTHSSNLDSIALGFGLQRSRLPPVTYGAGKNLFSNPFLSFFMYNLGAYRVDRRLKFSLYKDVLKEYSTVLLEHGYHSLFFPGGTRSRSNEVEQHLKLGLVGTGLSAYRNNLLSGSPARRIYVVPVTINYRLVLEAETLIEDYLEETGKSRYIIEDDEFSRLGRIIEFLRKLLAHESAVVLRFGRPVDPFGRETDDDGESLDHRGRRVDPASYFKDGAGRVTEDPQRDMVYTRHLGRALSLAFRTETVLLSTQIVCRVLFDLVRRRTGIHDVYRLLRLPPSAVTVEEREVCDGIDRLRDRVRADPSLGRLSSMVQRLTDREVLEDAIKVLATYHTRPVVYRAGERIRVGYMKLLYYYRNRTSHIPEEQR